MVLLYYKREALIKYCMVSENMIKNPHVLVNGHGQVICLSLAVCYSVCKVYWNVVMLVS